MLPKKVMLRIIIKLFIVLNVCISYGQYSPATFEKLYKEVTLEKNSNTDFTSKLGEVHSLLNNSELKTTEEKLKAYLILANLYNLKGDRTASIKYAEEGRKLAYEESLYLWESRFYGFKSSIYRNAEMHFLGEEELSKALASAKKADPSNDLYIFKANAYHEMAHYALGDNRIKDAMEEMYESNIWVSKINDSSKDFFLASNYQYMGILFNRMNKPDSALVYLNRSLNLTRKNTNHNTETLRNYVFNYIGEAYLKKNDFDRAKSFFDSVSVSKLQFRTIDLNQELYNNLTTYFEKTDNLDSIKVYKRKYDSITRILLESNAKTVNSVTGKLIRQNQMLEEQTKPYLWLILIIILGAAALLFTIKRKKAVKEETHVILPEPVAVKTEELNIAKETLTMLENKLAVFEKEQQFLDPNVSATQLANQFQTNTKYITYVIKKLYGEDFSTYINSLRIHYVNNLLKDDVKYRQYKISYLAEISGFSSHSKFAAVFKKVNGISPSEFIAGLENQ